MQIGIVISLTPTPPSAPLLFSGRLAEGLEAAERLGYHGVELNVLDPTTVDGPGLRRLVRAHGLAACALATGQGYTRHGLSLSNPEAEVRQRTKARLRAHVHLAELLGCAVIVGLIRGALSGDAAAQAEGRKRALDGLRDLATYAAQRGVSLHLEPLNRYETNFINTIPQGLEALEEVGATNITLLADTFHMNIEDVDMAGGLRAAGDRLGYVHLVDSNRQAPGCGHTDLSAILRALQETGYSGFLGAEIMPVPDDLTAATRFARYCQSAGVPPSAARAAQ